MGFGDDKGCLVLAAELEKAADEVVGGIKRGMSWWDGHSTNCGGVVVVLIRIEFWRLRIRILDGKGCGIYF